MSKFRAVACALAACTLSAVSIQAASAAEVTVKVTKIEAVDKADAFSKGDFYARITIDGEATKTDPVKQTESITPNWSVTKTVAGGTVNVKLEVYDKDVSSDDPIDINRIDNKRDLDFTVNTRNCRVDGFANNYKCGSTIVRAGKEKKSAEVTFTVSVKK